MSPVILTYRGRSVTAADLEAIRALLAAQLVARAAFRNGALPATDGKAWCSDTQKRW